MSQKNNFSAEIVYSIICFFYCQLGFSINTHINSTPSCIVFKDTTKTISGDTLPIKDKAIFKLNPKADIPITAICGGWSAYMLTKLYNKGASTPDQVLSLNRNNINEIDKMAIFSYNSSLDNISYYPFYASIPLPLLFTLTGNKMRSDFFKISFLYLEAMSVMGVVGTSATHFVDRYRPYAYDTGAPMSRRVNQNAKNSFYAGHVEIIACSTFFIAEIYSSYYPESKFKWAFYTFAGAATAGMAYMRFEAGMHFPSDIFLGITTGMLSGILVPYFHNHKVIKNADLSFIPFRSNTSQGLSMIYRFNK